jgi:hypothetical protein
LENCSAKGGILTDQAIVSTQLGTQHVPPSPKINPAIERARISYATPLLKAERAKLETCREQLETYEKRRQQAIAERGHLLSEGYESTEPEIRELAAEIENYTQYIGIVQNITMKNSTRWAAEYGAIIADAERRLRRIGEPP